MKKKSTILLMLVTIIITYSMDVFAAGCNQVIAQDLINTLNLYVYRPVKWLTPVLLLVLTSLDFAKVIFNGDDKGMSKATSNFLKRFVAALIVFFAPDIIQLLFTFINNQSLDSFCSLSNTWWLSLFGFVYCFRNIIIMGINKSRKKYT